MKERILKDFNNLADEIQNNYNRVKIVDNYDYYKSNSYTIFYLNKEESFEKFEDKWNNFLEQVEEEDLDYDEKIGRFEKIASDFDYFELGTVDLTTEKDFELEI